MKKLSSFLPLLFMGALHAETISIESVYTNRALLEFDKSSSGSVEISELPKHALHLKNYDTDKDEIIVSAELDKMPVTYLETKGKRLLNVLYKQTAHEPLYLDLYFPAESFSGPRPLVVYTHGGGWAAGNKQSVANHIYGPLFKKFIEKGYVVAAVNYRLWNIHGDSTAETCVIDCKDAIRYLATRSQELQINTHDTHVVGGSAGGHICSMLTLTSHETFLGEAKLQSAPYKISAGVAWYGFTNLLEDSLYYPEKNPNGRTSTLMRVVRPDLSEEEKVLKAKELSPTSYLSPSNPPLLVLHGDKDGAVSVEHAHYIQKKALEVGAPVTVEISKNAGHGWSKPTEAELSPSLESLQETTLQFVLKH